MSIPSSAPQIDILMATYNGAEFLAAQIRSLQSQTFTDWRLIVHDDGSTDGTVDLVRCFMAQDSRILLADDGLQFHGPALNFMHLLTLSDAPFAIFCDQDDIWLEDKLQAMYDVIAKLDQSKPQMAYSNSYVYDMQTGDISGYATLWHPTQLHETLFANAGVQGCALMMNAALRDVCQRVPEKVAMHDHTVTLAALTFGQVTYVDRRLMLYRRHSLAVTGATYKNRLERFTHFFARGKSVIDRKHLEAIRSFCMTYADVMPADKQAVFDDFFRFTREGRIRNLWHAFSGGYRLFGRRSILLVKILLRPMLN